MSEKSLAKQQDNGTGLAVHNETGGIMAAVGNEVQMIPGLDQAFRYTLPRLGKLHLGVKVTASSGKEYPKATDYFVLPDELLQDVDFRAALEALGTDPDRPTKLPIMLPCNSLPDNLRSSCDLYGSSRGLICRTYDGATCKRVNLNTGEMADEPCKGAGCADFIKKQCHWIHRLRFLLPDAAGIGIWQIDTTSINNRAELHVEMLQIKNALQGQLAMIDLVLTLEPREFQIPMLDRKTNQTELKKTTAHLLHIRAVENMRKLRIKAQEARTYDAGDIEDFDDNPDVMNEDGAGVFVPEEMEPEDALFVPEDDTEVSDNLLLICDELSAKLFASDQLYVNFIASTFKKNGLKVDEMSVDQLQTLIDALAEQAAV